MKFGPRHEVMAWLGPAALINVLIWLVVVTPEMNSVLCANSQNCLLDWTTALSGWAAALAAIATIWAMRVIHNKNASNDAIKQSLCVLPAIETCTLIMQNCERLSNFAQIYARSMLGRKHANFRDLKRIIEDVEYLLNSPDLREAERLARIRPPKVNLQQATLRIVNLKAYHSQIAELSADETETVEYMASWCNQALEAALDVCEFANFFSEDAIVFQHALMESLRKHNPAAIQNIEAVRDRISNAEV